MFVTRQLGQFAFRSVLNRHRDVAAMNVSGVIYVGLGDRFDDDRRLVRGTALTSSPGSANAKFGLKEAVPNLHAGNRSTGCATKFTGGHHADR
jgi:hypothetical protein